MKRAMVAFSIVCIVCLGALNVFAQGRGTIRGTVQDTTGAVVPGAKVTATHIDTGESFSVYTTTAGLYNIGELRPGTYNVAVVKAGFKTDVRNGITVALAAVVGLNFTLAVGSVTQTVQVTGAAPILKTQTPEVSTEIPPKAMEDLPLTGIGGRAPINFMFLAPGAVGNSFNAHFDGGQTFASELELDGLTLQSGPWLNTGRELTMPPEAIQEASLSGATGTANTSTGGGIMRFTTRGGTNEFHGNLYEFLNNTMFNSRGFFVANRGVTIQNEWGGSLGGPIRIPKIYNGKDRTFFFVNLNWFRLTPGPTNALTSLPTPAFRNGDFSALLPGIQIYNPATGVCSSGVCTRQPFPGNVIPAADFSGVSTKMLSYVPLPTLGSGFVNNAPNLSEGPDIRHNYTIRIDHRISEKQNVTGIVNRQVDTTTDEGPFAGLANGTFVQALYQTNLRFSYTYTFAPNIFNQLSVGLNRQINPYDTLSAQEFSHVNWGTTLGLKGIFSGAFPKVNAGDYTFSSTGGTGDSVTIYPQNVIPMSDSVSIVSGRHSIQFGFDMTKLFIDDLSQNGNGIWNFSPNETAFPGQGGTSGFPFASFLLGDVDSASLLVTDNVESKARVAYYGLFLQDGIKVTPRFTLDAGLRWDLYTPFRDANNVYSVMDPGVPNPAANGELGALVFSGNGPGRLGQTYLPGDSDTQWRNFGPHLGFAWSLTPRWVIRAGYSLDYFPPAASLSGNLRTSALGFEASPSFSSENDGLTPAFNWNNGFPAYTPPPFINAGYLVSPGQAPVVWDWINATTAPYRQEWSFNIQRQLGSNWVAQVGYVGVKGTHLASGDFNQNQVNPSYLGYGNLLNLPITDPSVAAAGFAAPYPSFQGSLAQALRPFPQYGYVGTTGQIGGSNLDDVQIGNSEYNSLQMTLHKQYSNGLFLLSSFTWAKDLTNADSQWGGFFGESARNAYNRALDKGLAPSDVSWSSSTAFNYELPFGPGKHVAGNVHGVVGKLLSGWELNGILTYQAANPISVGVNNTLPIFNATNYPNMVPGAHQLLHGCSGFNPATDLYLNVNAFSQPAPFTFGDAPVALSLRPCPLLNENLGLIKETNLSERVKLQLRFEYFNVFNRVQFGAPGTNVSAPFDFGLIGGQANSPRQGQVAIKITF